MYRSKNSDGDGDRYQGLKDSGLKPKDLIGIPWRVAFALQADGWWLRQDIIWSKPNPMPESVTDRCTKSHEYIFLLTKSARYYYDAEAVKEPNSLATVERAKYNWCKPDTKASKYQEMNGLNRDGAYPISETGRNRRSVWTITTKPYKEAHFATFPPEIPEICIKAGSSEKGCCPECGNPWERVTEKMGAVKNERYAETKISATHQGGMTSTTLNATPAQSITTGWRPTCTHNLDPVPCTILDPFSGAGTTGVVAEKLDRKFIGIELNPSYVTMSQDRIDDECGTLFSEASHA